MLWTFKEMMWKTSNAWLLICAFVSLQFTWPLEDITRNLSCSQVFISQHPGIQKENLSFYVSLFKKRHKLGARPGLTKKPNFLSSVFGKALLGLMWKSKLED